MKVSMKYIKDWCYTLAILCVCFVACLGIHALFHTEALIPAIFVLGVFLTSVITEGYLYGFIAVFGSVLAVNYAFTFPFFRFNFTMPVNFVSAIIMIIVAMMTCTLTVRLKKQEAIKAESEKERMRANLLRAVSHDLRTPLTTIYGASSTLLENDNELTEEQKIKMLQGISQDAQWLSRMVENLLSITKLDNGNVKIIKVSTVLDELIDSVLIKFQKRYPNQMVDVNLPEEFVVIPMDALLIEQVLLNLLENAVQHAVGMEKLSLNVTLKNDKVLIAIIDDGAGIDEYRIKDLFKGCYNAELSSSDSKRSNAGIGLSVCATIIKAHGGEIDAKNIIPKGACFTFSLDLEQEMYE